MELIHFLTMYWFRPGPEWPMPICPNLQSGWQDKYAFEFQTDQFLALRDQLEQRKLILVEKQNPHERIGRKTNNKNWIFPKCCFFCCFRFLVCLFLFALVLIFLCFLLQTALHSLCCYSSLFRLACRTSDHTLVKCQNHGWKTKCCKSVCRMPKSNAGYSIKPHDLVPIDGKTPVGPHPPQNPIGWILAKAHRFHRRHVNGQVGCRCHPQPTFSELGEVHRLAAGLR